MLQSLVNIEPLLTKMARSFCNKTHEDILQDTYLKLYDSGKKFEDISTGYIYTTMRSVFIDSIRKTKNTYSCDDFSKLEDEIVEQKISIDITNLNAFEKTLIDAHYGKLILSKDNVILGEIKGASLLKLSRESGISYRTLYTTLQKIKVKLCKDLEM